MGVFAAWGGRETFNGDGSIDWECVGAYSGCSDIPVG
jgi:hypothetical protein